MKERIQKIVFFILSMILLLLIFRWALQARNSESPYISFPNKIDTFR